MSTAIYIFGTIVFLALVASSIVDFVIGSKQKNNDDRRTLYASGIMTLITAVIVIVLFVLISDLSTSIGDVDDQVEKMYKFSTSYLFRIPEDTVAIPPRRSTFERSLPKNSVPQYTSSQQLPSHSTPYQY